ncbi:MAG TPA: hypothetical protein DC047_18325 [Blastocatellia bacterium]|nr:hypothetical protein [Blastocatellia bacterium]
MKVFLSYAVGPWDAPIAARLRAVAAVYDISILLPDRTEALDNGLPSDAQAKIQEADAIIVLATNSAPADSLNLVNLELQYATQFRKPIIALVEEGVQLLPIALTQVVYFNRYDPPFTRASWWTRLIKSETNKSDRTGQHSDGSRE